MTITKDGLVVLAYLMQCAEKKESVEQREIEKDCNLSKSQTSRILKVFEKERLIGKARIGRKNIVVIDKKLKEKK